MPAHRQLTAMTGDEFRAIIEAAAITQRQASQRLGANPTTLYRWLSDYTPISQINAQLIRERLKPARELRPLSCPVS